MKIVTCTDSDRARWDSFVARHDADAKYHRWNWKYVFENSFHWPTCYLAAEQDGELLGILPLVWQKSRFRNYISSMPHLNGGGILADNPGAEQALLSHAIAFSREAKAIYLELRQPVKHASSLATRSDKVGAVLELPPDGDSLLQQLDKKTRNLVRKSLTFGTTVEIGGVELLGEFYAVYRYNMRDLGSPAYAPEFFEQICSAFPEGTYICIARKEGATIAAAFLTGFKDKAEVMWASSYRHYLALKPNMFLYWNLLLFAARKQYKWFDFGRSSVDSSTLDFKLQWGARTTLLSWSYWLPQGATLPSTKGAGMQLARRIWRRLPLGITDHVGPRLMKYIPGV